MLLYVTRRAVTAVRTGWSAAHKPKSWCGTASDLSDGAALQTQLSEALKSAVARGGLLHAVVHVSANVNRASNAAPSVADEGLFDPANSKAWRRVVDTELAGTIEATRIAVLAMRGSTPAPIKSVCEGNGLILNITSLRGINPQSHTHSLWH